MNNKIIVSSLGFLLGVTNYLLVTNSIWLVILPIFGLLIYAILFKKMQLKLASIFVLLGFFYTWFHVDNIIDSRIRPELEQKIISVTGTINSLPKVKSFYQSFEFLVTEASYNGVRVPLKKIKLNWYDTSIKLKNGDTYEFSVKLKSPHGMFNYYGFDYESWILLQRIDAVGYVRSKLPYKKISHNNSWLNKAREIAREHLKDSSSEALLRALLLGDKSKLKFSDWQILRKTGTNHLLAISGLHLGLVAMLVLLVVRVLFINFGISFLRENSLFIASIVALAVVLMYAIFSGFSVSTQRSFIMLSVGSLALLLSRQTKPFDIWYLTLLVCLLFNPLYVLSAGFWLSFVAVFIIIYLLSLYKIVSLKGFLVLQLSLSLCLIPVLSVFGFLGSSLAVPANLLALPLISFLILPLLLISFVVVLVVGKGIVADNLLFWSDWLLVNLWKYLEFLSEFDFSLLEFRQIFWWEACLVFMGFLLLLLPRKFPFKYMGLLLLLPLFNFYENDKPALITVFDVGQGLSVLVETKKHVLLFDTAAKRGDSMSLFMKVVFPVLRNKNINIINKLIISHSDNDHSGGLDDVRDNFEIGQTLSSSNYANSDLCALQNWQWDGVDFSLIHPGVNTVFTGNNASCVLKISYQNHSILILSDIEKSAEAELLINYKDTDDIIVVAHHGSKTSTTDDFLDVVRPKLALISAGYKNRYGHPHWSILNKFKDRNIEVFNTATLGALEINLSKHPLVIDSYRHKFGRFWHNFNF